MCRLSPILLSHAGLMVDVSLVASDRVDLRTMSPLCPRCRPFTPRAPFTPSMGRESPDHTELSTQCTLFGQFIRFARSPLFPQLAPFQRVEPSFARRARTDPVDGARLLWNLCQSGSGRSHARDCLHILHCVDGGDGRRGQSDSCRPATPTAVGRGDGGIQNDSNPTRRQRRPSEGRRR